MAKIYAHPELVYTDQFGARHVLQTPLRCVHQTATMLAYMHLYYSGALSPTIYCLSSCSRCGQPMALSKEQCLETVREV